MPSSCLDHSTGLRPLTDPSSVAVVGASNNPGKWGYWLASGALEGRKRRTVHLVNHSTDTVLEQLCAPDLKSLPEVPELVALCVPGAQVSSVVEEGLAIGVRAFLVIAGGIPDEAALAEQIREGGARLLGPNSLGLYDADSGLRLAWGRFSAGGLAIVTQSGQLGSELALLCDRHGIGISRFVSVGNQSDVGALELLEDLAGHRSTRVIALYLEDFSDGERLFDTLRRLRSAGKPTLLLTVGGSGAGARVARSHTGSLTSATDLVDAACRAAGVLHTRTPRELVLTVRGLLAAGAATGHRVAIVGDSGGQCGIAADVASAHGLVVPELSEHTTSRLAPLLPLGAAHQNPVDLAGAGESDLTTYATVIDTALADPEVDAAVLTGYFGRYGEDSPGLAARELQVADQIAKLAAAHNKMVVVHTMAHHGGAAEALWHQGVPTLGSIEDAVQMAHHLAALSAPPIVPPKPRPMAIDPVAPHSYWSARRLLHAAGAALPDARRARTVAELLRAAADLTAPFVLKAGWIVHKSEVDAVRLDLADQDSLVTAFELMRARLGDGEYIVEEQDTGLNCLEMLVGARRDRALGPFVVVGRGGTETEICRDVVIERAPVSAGTAAAMLSRLRCAPLLAGWRGRPELDGDSLALLVVAISHLIAARPDIAEVELNPVRVAHQGALAVDALVIPKDSPCTNDLEETKT